jgi:hypothetical protein
MLSRDPSSSINSVRRPPHKLEVSLEHEAPAYLDEEYAIIIEIRNADTRAFDVNVDVLLQPTEIDGAGQVTFYFYRRHALTFSIVNTIRIGEERSTGLIKGVSFGVVNPGTSARMTLYLISTVGACDRVLDVSVQSRPPNSGELEADTHSKQGMVEAELDTDELLRTLVVPTVTALASTSTITYRRKLGQSARIAELGSFEADFWDDANGGEALVRTQWRIEGPWGIKVDSARLTREVCLITICMCWIG